LPRQELSRFDAILFDPPRAGAAAQAAEIAASEAPSVVAVSCNPATFARDARILIDGGYRLETVTPIDQFRFSPHVEIVGAFARPPAKKRAKGLLG
jgi:23S rRNA (uracil1939-C5)-methyltransferase